MQSVFKILGIDLYTGKVCGKFPAHLKGYIIFVLKLF